MKKVSACPGTICARNWDQRRIPSSGSGYGAREYATRGALLDLYPMGSDQPYRLDFFDDEIDSLRVFDAVTRSARWKKWKPSIYYPPRIPDGQNRYRAVPQPVARQVRR